MTMGAREWKNKWETFEHNNQLAVSPLQMVAQMDQCLAVVVGQS